MQPGKRLFDEAENSFLQQHTNRFKCMFSEEANEKNLLDAF